jgi:hypothetical protein
VTAFNSDCDEKYPAGRLELRDRKSKYRDRIVIRACGRTATVVKSGTSAVAVAISEPK